MKTIDIPVRNVGPVKIISQELTGEVYVPMATLETPLWPSTSRGARVSRATQGIRAVIINDGMARSVVVDALTAEHAYAVMQDLQQRETEIAEVVAGVSNYARLKQLDYQIVGSLLYVRLMINSGDASGHNMVTAAADNLLSWLLDNYKQLKYVSISANYCSDKKVSAVNAIVGRGKNVVAEILIPRQVCYKELRTLPEQIVDLHIKKNLLGSAIAGSLRSANAHFANMLLAVYLATGQDAANIVEGSQGIVHAEERAGDLYFSVTLSNLIVGTVGSGKNVDFAKENLATLGCDQLAEPGANARRLAIIIAATVLCGELSLLAAQTNPGELIRTHLKMERTKKHATSQLDSTCSS